MKDDFKVANISLKSRLIVGTGKYKNFKETAKYVKASLRKISTDYCSKKNKYELIKKTNFATDYLNPKKIFFYH